MNTFVIKSDLKNIIREPMVLLMYAVPLFITVVVKVFLVWGAPILLEKFNFEIAANMSYLLATCFALYAGMLGTATGFMMLDDRDARIYELIQITPIGRTGYLRNRMIIPVLLSVFYVLTLLLVIGYWPDLFKLVLLFLFTAIEAIVFGIILFFLAEDKVKGLTYAKGLNIIMIATMADLTKSPVVISIARLLPTYWLTAIVGDQGIKAIITGIVVHIVWLTLLSYKFIKSQQN